MSFWGPLLLGVLGLALMGVAGHLAAVLVDDVRERWRELQLARAEREREQDEDGR